MEFTTLLILIVIITGVIYFSRNQNKQVNLTLIYLTMCMVSAKDKDDFEKLLWRMYNFDSNYVGQKDFNTKWGTICEASKVPVIKQNVGGFEYISPEVIPLIAENIYENPTNKRYVTSIKNGFPDKMTLKELKDYSSKIFQNSEL